MEKNNNLLWAVVGVLVVVIIAVAAFFASQGATPVGPRGVLSEPVTAADWRLGAASSTVTLVEYADFECPACAAYHLVIKQLVADYPDQLAFIYRHFPLAQHRSARLAAAYAEAAGRQGQFWPMHDLIFANQTQWQRQSVEQNEATFRRYAQNLGLNLAQLEADLRDPAIEAKINSSYAAGTASGVKATPSFFLNGELISTPRSYNDFKVLIDNALSNSR